MNKITKNIKGRNIGFVYEISEVNNGLNVHVRIDAGSLQEFRQFDNPNEIIKDIATEIAIEFHPDAHFMFWQLSQEIVWQGQFHY